MSLDDIITAVCLSAVELHSDSKIAQLYNKVEIIGDSVLVWIFL